MLKKNYLSILITFVAFLISGIFILYVGKNQIAIENFIRSVGIFGPIATVLIYGALSVTPIPTDSLTLSSGVIFGLVPGIIISWLGNTLAAVVEYYAGKSISTVTHFESRKEKLPFGLSKVPVDSPLFLIGGRFVPGFGSKFVSVLAGIYNVKVSRYIWTAAVANIVGSVVYALGGVGLLNLFK